MSKSSDVRFEKDLLQALREPVRSVERNAARARVSRRLQVTLSQLEVGAAAALPLLLEAPPVAATQAAAGAAAQAKALAASTGIAAGAAGAASAGAGTAVTAAHPVSVLLTAFALGAGAGGGTLAALSAARVFEAKVAPSPTSNASVNSATPRSGSRHGSRAIEPAPSEPSSSSGESGAHVAPASAARVSVSPRVPAPSHVASANETASRAGGEASPAPRANSLTAQQALLDRARSALARGDGGQALAALSEDARIHPASELSEEREALLIKSLIAAGDSASARVHAAAFGARYPRSLFLPSIRAALPENP